MVVYAVLSLTSTCLMSVECFLSVTLRIQEMVFSLPFGIPVVPVAWLGFLTHAIFAFTWTDDMDMAKWIVVDAIAQALALVVLYKAAVDGKWTSQHVILLLGFVGIVWGHINHWKASVTHWFFFDGVVAAAWFPTVWDSL